MNRTIVYPGQIPLETDLLNTNRNAMVALAKLAGATLGSDMQVNGLACSPTIPASMQVSIGPGEIYALANLDGSAYSSLPADTTHQIVKQGINLDATLLTFAAPTGGGQAINYLVQATFQETDTGNVVLPYYNSANPALAFSGAGNSGVSQPTSRVGTVALSVKAGAAAAAGTQLTPSADAGAVPLWVITVATGQTTITSSSIAPATSAPFIVTPAANSWLRGVIASAGLTPDISAPNQLKAALDALYQSGRLLNVRLFTRANNGQAYVPTAGTRAVLAFAQAAGGSSSGLPATGGGQWTTAQGAASGACAVGYFTAGFSGVTMTIGQSVAPGVGSAGITGGSTSFGALMSATGGAGSGVPLVVGNSITTLSGPVDALTTTAGALWSFFGQAGGQVTGLGGSQTVAGNGGSSYFGVGGTGHNIDTSPLVHYDGLSGQGFGQGAGGGVSGGSCSATSGSKGGDGCILVLEFS